MSYLKSSNMKTKFFVAVLGVFALALTLGGNFTSGEANVAVFTAEDNVAYAFSPDDCGLKPKHYCIVGSSAYYNEEFCGSGGSGNQ